MAQLEEKTGTTLMGRPSETKKAVQDWWAANPMTYGKEHGETAYRQGNETRDYELGSREFFEQADKVFLRWNETLHHPGLPFGRIFDYEHHRGKNVMEIGCGMGFMSMNWGRQGANIFATDLNPVAVHQTRQRLNVFGVPGQVLQTDGERLPYKAASFSLVYSWGVLHHTPGIQKAIDEVHRVLEPGGAIGLMLYNRGSLRQRYLTDFVEGYLHLENEFLNPLELNSRYGDGARQEGNPHTWPVTKDEVRKSLMHRFENVKIEVLGTEVSNVLDLLIPGLGKFLLPLAMKKSLARRWGWSLWITANKPI